MIRYFGKFVCALWIFVLNVCRKFNGKKKETQHEPTVYKEPTTGTWNTDWEEWEGVEVKNTATVIPPSDDEIDIFKDMRPVIHTTKKICIHKEEKPNLQQFAVDPTFVQSSTSELTDWPEEATETEAGWEDEHIPNDLLRHSHEALRKKRQEEREVRRQQQQRPQTGNIVQLGATRIT